MIYFERRAGVTPAGDTRGVEPEVDALPRLIAVDGPPGAGATALAAAIARANNAQLIRDPAVDNPFRAELAARPERAAFQTQIYCLLARYRQQLELNQPELFAPTHVVCDYVFKRDALFAEVVLNVEELSLYRKVHALLGPSLPVPDLFVFVTADLEILRSRIRRLVPSADRVIKLNVLDRLAAAMNDWVFSYRGGPLLVINTSDYDFEHQPDKLEELTEVIRSHRAGVNHVRLI